MCVVSLLRIQKQILRSLHPHLEPRLTATLVPQIERKKGGGMKFLERLFDERPPFTAAIIAVFSILTNCFFNHVITTGMRSFYIPLSLIFFYLSTNFFSTGGDVAGFVVPTFVSRIYMFGFIRFEGVVKFCGVATLVSSFTRLQLWTSRQTRRTLSCINRYRDILTFRVTRTVLCNVEKKNYL